MEGLDRHRRQAASLWNCAGLFVLNQTATETKKRGEYWSPQGRGQAWDAWERRAQGLQAVRKKRPAAPTIALCNSLRNLQVPVEGCRRWMHSPARLRDR